MAKKPTPKQMHARASGRTRYSRFQRQVRTRLTNMVHLVRCQQCSSQHLVHMVCPNCGYYRGRKILDMEKKLKEKITKVTA